MIITTTQNIEGFIITEYLKPIMTSIVIGTDALSEFYASISDVTGARSRTFESKINDMHTRALSQLSEDATQLGANGIVGLRIDVDEISGKGMQMFMMNASGTAIKLISYSDHEKYLEDRNREVAEKDRVETERKERIKTVEDAIKDPEISKEADMLRRFYGQAAYDRFIESKLAELGLKSD